MSKVPWYLIIEILSRFPKGASLEEISIGLNPQIPRRTLQRWIEKLVQEEKIEFFGFARSRKYKLHSSFTGSETTSLKATLIPLCPSAKLINAQISKPLKIRKPVSYDRTFLEKYKPNTTYYLPKKLREKLTLMGKIEGEERPAGTYARHIFHRLLIDLAWNSSRLEGNTYSLLETERLIDLGKITEGKDLKDAQMILNHKAAIEFIIESAENIGINRYTILNLHTLLSDNLLPDSSRCGKLRNIAVGIAKSVYEPCSIPQVIEECFDLILSKAQAIEDPFELSFFLMVHIPYLQAFDDVNKRTSRLAANIPLIQKNFCPLSFIDLPEEAYINGLLGIYETQKVDLLCDIFEWAYERSCFLYSNARQITGEPDPFRLKYRKNLQLIIGEVVRSGMNKLQAIKVTHQYSHKEIPNQDQLRFIEIVERELQGLHEGNIARYQIGPLHYERWKQNWY